MSRRRLRDQKTENDHDSHEHQAIDHERFTVAGHVGCHTQHQGAYHEADVPEKRKAPFTTLKLQT